MTQIAADTNPVTIEPAVIFRGPSTSPAKPATKFTPPSTEFFQGTWRITHSTLPMWKSNRNVTITYTLLESPPGAIDDLVRYQPLHSDKEKQVRGIDTPDADVQSKYTWRGRGWLKITSSRWEILGFGEHDGGWLVTYFAKTLFTPAGVDVYTRSKDGISAALLEAIQAEMLKVEDDHFRSMADQIFKIHHD